MRVVTLDWIPIIFFGPVTLSKGMLQCIQGFSFIAPILDSSQFEYSGDIVAVKFPALYKLLIIQQVVISVGKGESSGR